MFLKNIDFKEFNLKKNISLKKKLNKILSKKNIIIDSLGKNYKNSYDKKLLNKYKKLTALIKNSLPKFDKTG